MIDLSPDDDQRALVAATRRALAGPAPDWSAVVGLGWVVGATSMPLIDQLLVFVELGRSLLPGPLIGTAVAARVLPDLGAGDLTVGLVSDGIGSDVAVGGLAIRVGPGRPALVRVADAEDVPATGASVPLVRVLAEEPVADLAGTRAVELLEVLLGGYLVGVAEATTQMSVDYALQRHQFGRPIGAFQAVKHRCAEMTIRAHVARAQLQVAALSIDAAQGSFAAAAGHVLAVGAARRNAEDNIQNHGGIGFTEAHQAGRYLSRAHVLSRLGPSVGVRSGVLLGQV